jgi:hypothetical protein
LRLFFGACARYGGTSAPCPVGGGKVRCLRWGVRRGRRRRGFPSILPFLRFFFFHDYTFLGVRAGKTSRQTKLTLTSARRVWCLSFPISFVAFFVLGIALFLGGTAPCGWGYWPWCGDEGFRGAAQASAKSCCSCPAVRQELCDESRRDKQAASSWA